MDSHLPKVNTPSSANLASAPKQKGTVKPRHAGSRNVHTQRSPLQSLEGVSPETRCVWCISLEDIPRAKKKKKKRNHGESKTRKEREKKVETPPSSTREPRRCERPPALPGLAKTSHVPCQSGKPPVERLPRPSSSTHRPIRTARPGPARWPPAACSAAASRPCAP